MNVARVSVYDGTITSGKFAVVKSIHLGCERHLDAVRALWRSPPVFPIHNRKNARILYQRYLLPLIIDTTETILVQYPDREPQRTTISLSHNTSRNSDDFLDRKPFRYLSGCQASTPRDIIWHVYHDNKTETIPKSGGNVQHVQ